MLHIGSAQLVVMQNRFLPELLVQQHQRQNTLILDVSKIAQVRDH
jgi:hypothetical protein